MQEAVKIGAAAAGGYLLGRTKKAKAAIGLAMWLAGRRRPADLARDQTVKLLSSPQVLDLVAQLRGPLLTAGKQAALSVVEGQAGKLSDNLQRRTEKLGGSVTKAGSDVSETGLKTARRLSARRRGEPLEEEGEEYSDEYEDEYAEDEGEEEEGAEPEEAEEYSDEYEDEYPEEEGEEEEGAEPEEAEEYSDEYEDEYAEDEGDEEAEPEEYTDEVEDEYAEDEGDESSEPEEAAEEQPKPRRRSARRSSSSADAPAGRGRRSTRGQQTRRGTGTRQRTGSRRSA